LGGLSAEALGAKAESRNPPLPQLTPRRIAIPGTNLVVTVYRRRSENQEIAMKLASLTLAGAMLATVPSIALAQQSSEGMITMINRLDSTIAIKQVQEGTVGASGGGATEQQFAASADMLDSVHAGDRVKFTVGDKGGKKTITKIERQ
jgi:hypothetical protein